MNIRKLNEIREVRNLSCVSIAEQSGVPYRTVSKLFSGENQNPTWETITAITRVLNCSLDELLNCCFSKRMRKVFRKNEKSMLQNCNKKAKRKGRLQRVKKPM